MESSTLPLEATSLAPLLNNPLVLTYTLVMSLMLLSLLRVSGSEDLACVRGVSREALPSVSSACLSYVPSGCAAAATSPLPVWESLQAFACTSGTFVVSVSSLCT